MIGAFYQPERVICDLHTLQSLPGRELSAGLAEVIKYGPIADMAFLDWIEAHLGDLLVRDPAALAWAVQRSCQIKADVVGQDEREGGLRAILNFGHTFGHAIEAGLGFGEWLHGEAVGCGMVMAANLSERLGLVDAAFVQRLTRVIDRAGLPTVGPALGVDTYMHHSTDGGKNFEPTGEKNKHVDNHCIWIDPSNTNHWLVGCDGGLYETYTHAKEWSFYGNLPIIQFYKVATDNAVPFYNIFGGTQDNNSMGGPAATNNVAGILNADWFITNICSSYS
jgi:hypothetical protein